MKKKKCKDNELKSANKKRKLHDGLSLLVEQKIIPRKINFCIHEKIVHEGFNDYTHLKKKLSIAKAQKKVNPGTKFGS
jgi:hypothetical protein